MSRERVIWPILALILLLAGWLRFSYPAWDGLKHAHPDELYIVWVATSMTWPEDLATALDPRLTTLNPFYWPPGAKTPGIVLPQDKPRLFTYGHLPLYLLAFTNQGLAALGGRFPDSPVLADEPQSSGLFGGDLLNLTGRIPYDHLLFTGRAISALADSLTVLLAFLLARRLFGPVAGLLAAAMLALAVLHIQLAHFATFDVHTTTFVTACLYFLVRFVQDRRVSSRRRRDVLLAGVFLGMAVGSKFAAILLFLPLIVACALHAPRGESRRPTTPPESRRRLPPFLRPSSSFLLPLALATLAAFLVYALTNPFALIEFRRSLGDISTQGRMVRGAVEFQFTQQYWGTAPYWYYFEEQARWGLGWPLALAAYGGLLWAGQRAIKDRASSRRDPGLLVVLAWVVPFLLVTGSFFVKFPRYMLPVVPALVTLGAGAVVHCGRGNPTSVVRRGACSAVRVGLAQHATRTTVLAALVLLPTAAWASAFLAMYRQPHPWVTASEWIYRNVPPDAVIVTEEWDSTLPMPIKTPQGEAFTRKRYTMLRIDAFARPDDEEKLHELLTTVSLADYVVIASNRMYGVAPRLSNRYPLTSAYYRAVMSGDLGFQLVSTAARYPQLFGWTLADDPFAWPGLSPPPPLAERPPRTLNVGGLDESLTVYDHPRALIFENTGRLSVGEMEAVVRGEAGQGR